MQMMFLKIIENSTIFFQVLAGHLHVFLQIRWNVSFTFFKRAYERSKDDQFSAS
jgi:hypothetical protein